MTRDHDDVLSEDEEPTRFTRRRLLRGSVYGLTGIGLASLLAACGGGEDEEEGEGAEETESGEESSQEDENASGIEEVDEQPDPEDNDGEGAEDDD